jgi:hypothetical protein
MATETTFRSREVSRKRLWFGLSAAALCWMGLGIADVLITWRECLHQEQFGGASSHPGMLTLNIVIFLVLLAIAIVAGVMSYRNWRLLAGQVKIYRAEANGSHEYLALLGVFISITLGLGIIWFGIPLMILSLCVRTR